MTLSRPRTTRRVLRGSALGLGLLVAGGMTAPAALAAVDPAVDQTSEIPVETGRPVALEDVPAAVADDMSPPLEAHFGTGKSFTVQVQPHGPVPADLDLSGAEFRATPVTVSSDEEHAGDPEALREDTSYTCTTDQTGACTFHPGTLLRATHPGADAYIPAGQYTLTQVSSSAGLQATTDTTTFGLDEEYPWWLLHLLGGDVDPEFLTDMPSEDDDVTAVVGNDSLFRTSLVTTVLDQDTQEPIAGAGYTLTAPDYPHRDDMGPLTEEPTGDAAEESPADQDSAELGDDTEPVDPDVTTGDDGSTDGAPVDPSEQTGTEADSSPQPLDLVGDETTTSPATVDYAEQVSDEDGVLTFGDGETTWFPPGAGYTLTPTSTVPEGYTADTTYAFAVGTTTLQAAVHDPLQLVRTLGTGVAPGQQPSGPQGGSGPASGGDVAAGTTAPDTTAAGTTAAASTAAATTASPSAAAVSPAADAATLANTGSPVGTLALVGGGLVALGGGAMAAGAGLRRRARQRA